MRFKFKINDTLGGGTKRVLNNLQKDPGIILDQFRNKYLINEAKKIMKNKNKEVIFS